MTLSLDAIADGASLDGLTPAGISALLNRAAAVQTRLACRLLELAPQAEQSREHDSLIGPKEAAERLGVAPSWLYRHATQLAFTVRVGAHLRFSQRGVERFIRSRTGTSR